MSSPATRSDPGARALHGSRIIAAIKDAGIDYVLSVPDITTSAGLLKPIAEDNSLRRSMNASPVTM